MEPAQTWKIAPEQYAAMLAEVTAAGIPISGNAGTASKQGVTVSWSYDGETLSITVEKRSWYDPSMEEIEARIASAVNKILAG